MRRPHAHPPRPPYAHRPTARRPRPSRRAYQRALLEAFEPRLLLSALPSFLHETDIGSPSLSGSTDYNADANSYAITGSGSWIWYSNDQFHYVYQQLIGDGSITVRITDPGAGNPSWENPKSGIMIRQNLADSAANAALVLTPNGNTSFQFRGQGEWTTSNISGNTYTAPVYLQLTKSGDTLTAKTSADGSSWTTVGTDTLHFAGAFYVGMIVDSENAYVTNTATFDNLSVTGTSPTDLPTGWQDDYFGNDGVVDSASYDNGTFTFSVNGGGTQISGTTDEFNYAYQGLPADGSIIAHVADAATTSSTWALGGIMIRDGIEDDSAHASMILAKNGTVQFLDRDVAGDNTTAAYGTSNDTWLKLTRVGDLFTGYNSADGVTWTQISSATISMTGPVYISLVANSGNTTDGQTVAFDNVTLTGTTPQGPATPTNLAVTFNDSSDALFSWDAAPSGDSLSGYNLYMSTDGGTTFSLADTLTDPTATSDEITGLTPNTPYTFQLKASDNNDNESDPATASATSPDGILAPVISSITPGSLTPYGTGSVTITWSSNTASGIDKAYVELREPGDSNWFTDYEIPNPNSDTSATLSDLYVGAIYQARIRFVTDDASAYSAAQSITTAGYSGDTSLDQITAVPSPTPDPNHPDIVPVGMNIDWTSTVDNPPDHYLITQDSNNPLFPDRWYMSTDHSSGGALLGSLSYGGFDAQSGSGLITNSSDWSLAAGFSGSRPTDGTTPIITSATTDGNGNITLQWSGNSTGYYVVNLTTDLIDNVTGNSVTFTDNDNLGTGGHSMNRFGYYAVVGYQNISSGQLFTPMSNLVDLSKANTPKWAQAGNYTANSLTLFWDNTSYNETGYQIYRLNTTTGLYDLKATVKPDVTQWTDTDVALDGRYTYQIQATRANTTLNSQPTTVAATMPSVTIDSITASMNGDSQSTSKARDDTSLTIDDGDTISAVYNTSQTLDFKANNLSPNTVAAKNLIKWTVQPDPAKANPLPTFTPDATDPLQAHMMLDKAGSFNVIVYVDKNSNGNFDPGEQLRVLHLVIATLTIDPTQITSLTPPNAYTATLNANTVQFQEANSNTHAYNVTVANVLLTAGGANSRVGIFEASQNRLPGAQKVNPGWIQNGTGDTAQMAYGQAGTGNDGLVAGTTFPLLDAFGQNPGTGGVTAMEPGGASNWGRPPTGGMSLTEKDIDTPTVSFDQQHTFVQNNGPVQATQLSGSFTFTDSLSLVSTDFPTTYSAYLQIQWNVTFNFVWDGKAWVDKGTVAAILKTTPMPNGGSPGATAAPVWTAKETKTYQ